MRIGLYLIICVLLTNCSSNKSTYWCGDHPCINNKEREAYFKKTMIVEKREVAIKDKKDSSEIAKIIEQAKISEKKRILKEKNLSKQDKLNEKKRRKLEKKLAKEKKKSIKKALKDQKKLAKKNKKKVVKLSKKENKKNQVFIKTLTKKSTLDNSSAFANLVEIITRKNSVKPYPDINDIPK